MTEAYNGMPAGELRDVQWVKSRYSGGGECVEVAELGDRQVAIRNSRFPHGPALVYTQAELAAFVAGAKNGEFDHMVS